MDYAEVFERQGRLADDLLLHAFQVKQEGFVAPGPEGAPSLRDLLIEWLETQRRAVHGSLRDYPYQPLPPAATANIPDLARCYGGFRMTLRDTLDETCKEDLERRTTWTAADGTAKEVSVDEVLAHLAFHGARMSGLIAQRLRQLGTTPPSTDLL